MENSDWVPAETQSPPAFQDSDWAPAEDTYGGLGGMASSAGLGALRGASLGASDVALTSTGLMKPETLKGYQETNPTSSMAGEALGAVGSAVLAPELAPVALINKAGKAVQGGLLAADALKTGKALSAVSQIVASGAGSAVEGALYSGVANTLTEHALGDPSLNGEKIAAHFGHGAILGGGLGGFLKAAELGVPEATKALSRSIGDLTEKVMGEGVDGSGGLIGKALPQSLSEAWGNRISNLEGTKRETFVKGVIGDLNAIQKNAKTSLKEVSESINPEITSELIQGHKEWLNSLKPQGVEAAVSPVELQLETHGKVLEAFEQAFEKKSPFTDAFMTNSGSKKNPSFEFDFKKVEKAISQGDQDKLGLLNSWLEQMKTVPAHVEETLANIPNETMDKTFLNHIEDLKTKIVDGVESYKPQGVEGKPKALDPIDLAAAFLAHAHPAVASAMELWKMSRNPLATIKQLAEIERVVGKTTEAVNSGAKAIFSSSLKLGDVSKNVVSRLKTQEQVTRNQDLQKELASFQANPGAFADHLGSATGKLYNTAPEMAQSLQLTSANAIQFLSSKIPSKPQANMFESPYEPSKTELATFDRYMHVIEKPTLALEQVKSGLLGPETMEVLSAVYPKLLDQMRQTVQLEAAKQVNAGKELPYQLKQSISMFLGQPLSQSLLPQNVMNNQTVYAQVAQMQMQKDRAQAKNIKDQSSRTSLHSNDDSSV